ncbi:MAG: ion transporter [Rhodocyclales bacterium]|nr:ion transporter [Rhodocyclales bacterium]
MRIDFDDRLRDLLALGPTASPRAQAYRWALTACILGSTAYVVLDTVPGLWGGFAPWVGLLDLLGLSLMSVDYLLRLRLAWSDDGWGAVGRYALSPYGLIDLAAVAPFALVLLAGMPADAVTAFGVFRFLKLARYSPALETLGTVVLNELWSLLSALFIIVLLAISAATLLYFAERQVNPAFASVPNAMWWAIVTLTTVGYGDVVPLTALGRMLAGIVAVLGLCMFALPASILASGFAAEMHRRSFIANWQLVSKVPFFTSLSAGQIAGAAKGEVVMQEGDSGEYMYCSVSGRVEGAGPSGRFVLKAGDFFGEIALLERCPRIATVRTLTRCQFLMLGVRDFNKFVAGYPELLASIKAVARQRLGRDSEQRHTADRRHRPDRRARQT